MRKKADYWLQGFEWFSNRYVLTAGVGLVWVTFISEIDLVYLAKSQLELNRLENQVAHYELEIEATRNQLVDLSSNPERLERFAREKYFMKRDNEDLFRIVAKEPEAKNPNTH
jgi:cell division protein DivIC